MSRYEKYPENTGKKNIRMDFPMLPRLPVVAMATVVAVLVTVVTAAIGVASPPQQCTVPGNTLSNTSWNKFPVPNSTKPVVWVHAHIGKPTGIPNATPMTVYFSNVTLNFSNGGSYSLPNGQVTFDPSLSGKTVYHPGPPGTLGHWETVINTNNLSDEIFFTGAAIPITDSLAKGGKATLSFTATSSPLVSFPWQWSAAVYTFWPADWNDASIQGYHSSYHAGAPTNKELQGALDQGARGGAGSNFTGSWSATGSGGTCPLAGDGGGGGDEPPDDGGGYIPL